MKIRIIESPSLPEGHAQIQKTTFERINKVWGGFTIPTSINHVLVGEDPFRPAFILNLTNDQQDDNALYVSPDVKRRFYSDKLNLEIEHA